MPLAAVDGLRHLGGEPEVLARRVDLDQRGPELREQLTAPRPRHCDAEVEHGDAGERALHLRAAARGRVRRAITAQLGRGVGFRLHRVGVLAARRAAAHLTGRLVHPVHEAALAQRAELGVFDLHDRALRHQRGIGVRLLGCAHRLHRDPGFRGDPHPLGRGELLEDRDDLEARPQRVFRAPAAGADGTARQHLLARRALELVARARHLRPRGAAATPVAHPCAVGALVERPRPRHEPDARARFHDRAEHAGVAVVFVALPRAALVVEDPLEQRRLDVLPAPGVLTRAQRTADPERREVRRRDARRRRCGHHRSVTLQPVLVFFGELGAVTEEVDARDVVGCAPRPRARLPLVADARRRAGRCPDGRQTATPVRTR